MLRKLCQLFQSYLLVTSRHIGGETTVNPSGGAVTRICSSSVMDESKCGKKGGKGRKGFLGEGNQENLLGFSLTLIVLLELSTSSNLSPLSKSKTATTAFTFTNLIYFYRGLIAFVVYFIMSCVFTPSSPPARYTWSYITWPSYGWHQGGLRSRCLEVVCRKERGVTSKCLILLHTTRGKDAMQNLCKTEAKQESRQEQGAWFWSIRSWPFLITVNLGQGFLKGKNGQ